MPSIAEALDVAAKHYEAGKLAEAESAYRQVLDLDPGRTICLHRLGLIACQAGRIDVAIDLIGRALALDPEDVTLHNDLGVALYNEGRRDQAMMHWRRALDLRPDDPLAYGNLGVAWQNLGRFDQATEQYRRAVALKPEFAAGHSNLGVALMEMGRFEDAEGCFRRVLELTPQACEAYFNLASALEHQGRLEQAIVRYEQALALQPGYAQAHLNFGCVLQRQGRVDAAIARYQTALRLLPDLTKAHTNLAIAQLLVGDFEAGWRQFEWRWQTEHAPKEPPHPLWAGEELAGKTILLYPEQGFGNVIQFLRYVPLVAARGARVVLETPARIARLAATLKGRPQVIATGDPLPPVDLCCPLLSLPRLFATRLDTIPAEIPYLAADPVLVARWRQKVGDGAGLKVGLAWAGNPKTSYDRERSIALDRLRPLLEVPGIRWFSLQVGERAADVARLPPGAIRDLSAEQIDFAETAALIENLDLVLTVNTAAAHLAGALGRPGWVMLPFAPDWRWLLGREDSPWYPTLRLFRQPAPGAWDPVIARVAQELAGLSRRSAPPRRQGAETTLAAPPGISGETGPAQLFQTAQEHHQAGRLDAAEAVYRNILEVDPDHVGSLLHLGLISFHAGRNDEAAELVGRALAVEPDHAEGHNILGAALGRLGKPDEAVVHYRRAVALAPGFAGAHHNLANVLLHQGRPQEAAESFKRALALKPDYPEAHNNLAVALIQLGRIEEAMARCEQALALKPDYIDAHLSYGAALQRQDRLDEAITRYLRALALKPDQGRGDEDLALYLSQLPLTPDHAETLRRLGLALERELRLDEAAACYRKALDLKPELGVAPLRAVHRATTDSLRRGRPDRRAALRLSRRIGAAVRRCRQRAGPRPSGRGGRVEPAVLSALSRFQRSGAAEPLR